MSKCGCVWTRRSGADKSLQSGRIWAEVGVKGESGEVQEVFGKYQW